MNSTEETKLAQVTYVYSTRLFLRLLALVYLIAFFSAWVQIEGLIGSNGILPAKQLIQGVLDGYRGNAYLAVPSLFWIYPTDTFLNLLCLAGIGVSFLALTSYSSGICFLLLWLLYLSIVSIGNIFFSYQWDVLLLEAGFLAIFFAPKFFGRAKHAEASAMLRWLIYFLLFRLMFSSGLVKLLSGDSTWRDLTALNYHYFTQPLPNTLAYYAHQMPTWFQKVSMVFMYFVELVVPVFIFIPSVIRRSAGIILIAFQLLIAATGNYTFFNLLTIVLCIPLFDDAFFKRAVPKLIKKKFPFEREEEEKENATQTSFAKTKQNLLIAFTLCMFVLSTAVFVSRFGFRSPEFIESVNRSIGSFRSINSYGLFAVMTTSRPEIIIEGSHDGETWLPYELPYKPGKLSGQPKQAAPHQPRLDWQLWFAALGSPRSNYWVLNLLAKLLADSPEVKSLFAENPFKDKPPTYLRAQRFEYEFTTIEEKRNSGEWWKRALKDGYLPAISSDMIR